MLLDGGVLMRHSVKPETIYLKTQAPAMNRGIEPLRARNLVTNSTVERHRSWLEFATFRPDLGSKKL